jgi:hypothetical protein
VATRVPATYTIAADGALTPPAVSAPAGYDVQVAFIDPGPDADAIVVHTHTPVSLAVGPGARTYVLLKHPPKGTYGIDINGRRRGTLVIGSSPGP